MKQFCMKIDLIFHGRENVLFLPSNMTATTSHENALFTPWEKWLVWLICSQCLVRMWSVTWSVTWLVRGTVYADIGNPILTSKSYLHTILALCQLQSNLY